MSLPMTGIAVEPLVPLAPPALRPDTVSSPVEASHIIAEFGSYAVRLAETEADRRAAYRLRFIVFNLEMNEGLETSYADGYDTDRFDEVCDHLILQHKGTGEVVGTYRLQPGNRAAAHHGYYSAQEFDLTPFEPLRSQVVELGRACIHRDHRAAEVLNLLWRGIMRYSLARGGRYLLGCCSLTSQDIHEGSQVYASLRNYCVEPELFTKPMPQYAMELVIEESVAPAAPPKLLRAYLAIGAKICAAPAIDRDFGTIDFLTVVDLQTINPSIARRFL